MEYAQITMDEYLGLKKDIHENIASIAKSFVRIGETLFKIDQAGAYKLDGYKTLAEFAKAEYDMTPDGVSRFVRVYKKYCDNGAIRKEYEKFNYTKLVEMLDLSEEDEQLIQPDTPREVIRDLKRFNKEGRNDTHRLETWKSQETEEEEEERLLKELLPEVFREREQDLDRICGLLKKGALTEREFSKIINPSRTRMVRKGRAMAFFSDDEIQMKIQGRHVPALFSYEELLKYFKEVFAEVLANKNEQTPGQMEIEDHPDVLPNKEIAPAQKNGKCLHRPEFMCTLMDEDKESPGIGKDCNRHCCWDCVDHGDCKLECDSSANRPDAAEVQREEENAAEEQQDQHQAEQPVSAYGLPVRTYPPDSLIATPGCGTRETGELHDCFSCHMDGCQIRQEECHCVEAPLGNPFPCTILEEMEDIREELGDQCQFADHDLAYHRAGDNGPVPCCKDCENLCIYACDRARKALEKLGGSVPEKAASEPDEAEQEDHREEKLPDESWNIGDLPQAKESLLKQLARVLVEKMGDGMITSGGRLSAIISDETAREKLQELDRKEGGSIRLPDNVAAYASDGIVEFYRGDEDLGVCSYARFGTQVRKAFDEWMAERNSTKLKEVYTEPEPVGESLSDMNLLCSMLEKEKRELEEFIQVDKVDKLPEDMIRKKKILVAALANLKCDWEGVEMDEPQKPEQPELPVMKNNDQRKEWLRNYKDWGLWYEDEHIGARYYKYEFANGAVLIAEEYDCSNQCAGDYTTSYLHLVGGPEPPKHSKYGLWNWQRNERYNRYPNSETELVEFLKEVQKSGRKS